MLALLCAGLLCCPCWCYHAQSAAPSAGNQNLLPHGQGYGLTETCAASFIGIPDQIVRICAISSIGLMLPSQALSSHLLCVLPRTAPLRRW